MDKEYLRNLFDEQRAAREAAVREKWAKRVAITRRADEVRKFVARQQQAAVEIGELIDQLGVADSVDDPEESRAWSKFSRPIPFGRLRETEEDSPKLYARFFEKGIYIDRSPKVNEVELSRETGSFGVQFLYVDSEDQEFEVLGTFSCDDTSVNQGAAQHRSDEILAQMRFDLNSLRPVLEARDLVMRHLTPTIGSQS